MKAKACVKCRQWKARCDAELGVGKRADCSRCLTMGVPCIFDATFKRIPRERHIQEMAEEIHQLRQAVRQAGSPSASSPPGEAKIPTPGSVSAGNVSFGQAQSATSPAASVEDVNLSSGDITSLFRCFFTRCHRYLPFEISTRSPETVRERCPLLFWVICAVASGAEMWDQLAPKVKRLVLNTMSTPIHSVETVQALLLLCCWPFRASFSTDDPSYLYSGLATQVSFLVGLHRPTQTHAYRHEWDPAPVPSIEVKTTTWLACYIVNHQQACYKGMPPSMAEDHHLQEALDYPFVDRSLSQLCRIYSMLSHALREISCNGPDPSGLQGAQIRLEMILHFREQLSTLMEIRLEPMSDMVKVNFLHAKVQIQTFALQEDMPQSPQLLSIITDLERDTCDLVDLCHGMNLALAPMYFKHALTYSGFVIVRILHSSLCDQREMLEKKLATICQALRAAAASQDDMPNKACLILQALSNFEDIKQTPPILSRMAAWISYDARRIYWENMTKMNLHQDGGIGRIPESRGIWGDC